MHVIFKEPSTWLLPLSQTLCFFILVLRDCVPVLRMCIKLMCYCPVFRSSEIAAQCKKKKNKTKNAAQLQEKESPLNRKGEHTNWLVLKINSKLKQVTRMSGGSFLPWIGRKNKKKPTTKQTTTKKPPGVKGEDYASESVKSKTRRDLYRRCFIVTNWGPGQTKTTRRLVQHWGDRQIPLKQCCRVLCLKALWTQKTVFGIQDLKPHKIRMVHAAKDWHPALAGCITPVPYQLRDTWFSCSWKQL